jgi:glycosyltransferase involved in cell wall biosynthesis
MQLSVVIPTFNPRPDYLRRVLESLRRQTVPPSEWELLIVDNGSAPPVAGKVDLAWHPHARLVTEETLGLTNARVRGFRETIGEVVILVDDDNVLDPDYLGHVAHIAGEFPHLGTWSGRLTLEFEDPKLAPPRELAEYLTLRELPCDIWSNDPSHNASTPWGAGMCVRRMVCDAYQKRIAVQPGRARLDLHGTTLLYGGDTDIAFTGCAHGLGKGVFTRLHITHLIPNRRCDRAFLLRSIEGQGYSEVLHGWLTDGIVHDPRRDFIGRLGELVRWITMSRLQRVITTARRRGRIKAFRELLRETRTRR